jgi:hypothetical protein
MSESESISREEIVSNPGTIPARIIFDTLANNGFKIWLIGHTNGMLLFNLKISDDTQASVAFTESDLAKSYINRRKIRNSLLKNFGKKLVLVGTSLMHLQTTINPMNYSFLANLVINPNPTGDFFIPLPLAYINELIEKDVLDYDASEDDEFEIIEMRFDKEDKMFYEDDENFDDVLEE